MSITEERLAQLEKEFVEYDAHNLVELIDEIRHQRAENKELRDSYERVEKYAQDLLQEREVLAAMVPSK